MNTATELPKETMPVYFSDPVSANSLILQGDSMDRLVAIAETMATSRVTVPKHLQNSMGDCLAVAMQAMQWGMNPYAVAQKTHLVNDVLGYEAQLVNAVVQASGAITGRFHYEYKGEGNDLECRVGAVPRGEAEIVWNEWLKSSTVTTKNSPLWKTNPKQQMGYLQVKNWARAYAPGAILGVYSTDELEEIAPERVINPSGDDKKTTEGKKLPPYTDEKLEANKAAWQEAITTGKKTPDQIIATISSKYAMTDEHKRQIRNLAAIEGEASPAAGEAVVTAMLKKAEGYAIGTVDICKHLGIEMLDGISVAQIEKALKFIDNPIAD